MANENQCEECKSEITQKVKDYSVGKFGKMLCFNCQKKQETPETSGTEKDNIPQEYIILLQGKNFITHQGLLYMAHQKGVEAIITEMIGEPTDKFVMMKATVTMPEGRVFTGYGDASIVNVNAMISKHLPRMAETRAINRALRLATNIGMTSLEELGDNKTEEDNVE